MEQIKKSIYARVNSEGAVEGFFSDVFEKPLTDDVLIESGNADYHAHVHLKYKAIDEKGLHNYKVANGVLTVRTEEEKANEEKARPKPPLSLEEKVELLKNSQAEQDEAIILLYERGEFNND